MTQQSARLASLSAEARVGEEAVRRCEELGGLTDVPGQINRGLGGAALEEAFAFVEEWLALAGASCRRDPFGNLVGRLPARPGQPVLMVGSHLDTVPDGGRYDGALGVVLAVALAERWPPDLPFALEVVVFADEEGRFGKGCLGSRAFVGGLTLEDLALERADGRTLAECLHQVGRDPAEAVGNSQLPRSLLGYLEVHIEQDTVLEQLGRSVGVVTRIFGKSRARASFLGRAEHTGQAVPGGRRDASCAMAELILAVERATLEDSELRATVGALRLEPDVVNVVPGEAACQMDLRHPDDVARRLHLERVRTEAESIAERRGLTTTWDALEESDSVACDGDLIAALSEACAPLAPETPLLVSWPGHDAAVIGSKAPVSLLFVRCLEGLTHRFEEAVDPEDVDVAFEVLLNFVQALSRSRGREVR